MPPWYSYDVFVSYRWVSPDQLWVREQLEPALKGFRVIRQDHEKK